MPESRRLVLADTAATECAGRELAAALGHAEVQGACIYLHGDLGAGKTSLVRAVLNGLGYTGRVPSPTYTLVEPYEIESRRVFHLDLYRLADASELEYLGIDEIAGSNALLFVEWPEHGAGRLPAPDLDIALEVAGSGRNFALQATSTTGQTVLRHWPE
ncbi:MAG: tRNA (adenosine(37)-N6)-threonylcarbamoyltransferase complex ATPase subunit type 1 TsaE [Gammaproteobacteria bacterium]